MPSEKSEIKNITVPWVASAPQRGDSLAMVVLGHPDTLSVTMEEMIHHCRAVRRGVKRALLVADMPYGSFHLGAEQAVANAIRFIKDSGAQAVKIEGGRPE